MSEAVGVRPAPVQAPREWHLFVPKLFSALREGYGRDDLRSDIAAGLTVAIVALPLSMALAIASGVAPERGLYTAAIAGLFISAFGGSRYQIGGPTGAFVVVVFDVVQKFGYDGLVIATIMAGLMLMAAGLLRLGTFIKYIPYPVVTGFTSGIAVIIFSSQIGDILGLRLAHIPGDVLGKWQAYVSSADTFSMPALAIALGSLGIIVALRRFAPRSPAFLVGIVAAGAAAVLFHLPIETIGTRFGALPSTLPAPHLPATSFHDLRALLPSAFTIFALGGIESLLSAVVADGMTGRRHRSNLELVAQGVANIASAIMGGIPATGAIARTATSIRAGARSPIAGIVQALAILAMMAVFAPLAAYIPLAALGAVLVIVCWNMAEIDAFRSILSGPWGDRAVLLATFGLTVAVDLPVAIATGVVMAAFLFMHRMAKIVESETRVSLLEKDVDEFAAPDAVAMPRERLPDGIEVFKLGGPFFFGAAAHVEQILARDGARPRVIVLDMEDVPLIDSTGAETLRRFVARAAAHRIKVLLAGVGPGPGEVLDGMGVTPQRVASVRAAVEAILAQKL